MNNRKILKTTAILGVMAASVLTLVSLSSAQNTAAQPGVITTRSHVFTPVAEGIYHVNGTGAVNLTSNAMLIEGAHDLLVVDSHVSPNAGLALLESIKSVSSKPVRYLINTHYHFDHTHGNQVFPQEVEIIGHRYTRDRLSGEFGNVLEESTFLSFTEGVPGQLAALRMQLDQSTDAEERARLQSQLATQQAHLNSVADIEPTPPNITIEDSMTIYQAVPGGGREIQILHLGRGHTGGDVVVFLPDEKIVHAGDMVGRNLIYMGDAYLNEWPQALERLKALDFEILLSGHGPVVNGKERIEAFQAYQRDLWTRTEALQQQGLTAEQAAEQIDMTDHSDSYPQIRGAGADVRAIRRVYSLLD